MGGGGADVIEGVNLIGLGDDGLVSGGATWWVCLGSSAFLESYGKASQKMPHSFAISTAMCFWSTRKGEKVNVVEVLTDKCVEVWENLRLHLYSNEGLLSVSEVGVEAWWGRGHKGMFEGEVFMVLENGLLYWKVGH